MILTKKFTIFILLCSLFINNVLFCYPVLGEFYKSNGNSGIARNLLILVENNTKTDSQAENRFKCDALETFRKLLSDNEIDIILEDRLDQISNNIKKVIDDWSNEFEADSSWNSIIEQNYSNLTPSAVIYKNMKLDPKGTTKLFVLLSKMKTYINNLPLKEHLNFVRKLGAQKDNNFFKSCSSAKNYFKSNKKLNQVKHSEIYMDNIEATVILSDWRSTNIMNIATNYKKGLLALSQDHYFIDKQSWQTFLEDIARTFVPQNTNISDFSPVDKLTTKALLNDLEVILKKINQLENASTIDAEKELWANFKSQIQKARNHVLNSVAIFKNLAQEDKNCFENLFKEMPKYHYAQLHWFAIVYAYMLKDKNPDNAIYPDNDEWINILTDDLLHAGLMDAILDSKAKQTKAVIYLNQNSYKFVSHYLSNLGYKRIVKFNNLSTSTPISTDELQILINQFPVSVSRIKQVLKPISYSIKF